MDLSKIRIGENPPNDINVLIEIPQGGAPVKYEMDKASGAMFVNRFLHTAMFYPANYGFIPNTLSEDGDPCDAMVMSQIAVASGAVIRARPIGALMMEDEAGIDEKIIAVPIDKLSPYYSAIKELNDLPAGTLDVIKHFFQHYKDLERGKWVKVVRWVKRDQAKRLILEGIERAAGISGNRGAGGLVKRAVRKRNQDRA
jgi:inorganic pyrophosphatase